MSPSPSFPEYQQGLAAQQQMSRGIELNRTAVAPSPEHPYVIAAQRWTGAKQRLDAARVASDQISREMTEATLFEAEMWEALAIAAERIDKCVPAAPVRR